MKSIGILLLVFLLLLIGCQNNDDDDNDDSDNDGGDDDNSTDDDNDDSGDTTDDDSSDDDTTDDDIDDDDTGPDDVYVSVNGDDANPGTQTEPKRTITAGVELVAMGGSVRVAAGTYAESVSVSGVSLLGGYEDSGWTRDIAANQTSIEGLVDQPALTITGASTKEAIEVGGFSIQGYGSSNEALAISIIDGANAIINDNVVGVFQTEKRLALTKRTKDFPYANAYIGIYVFGSTVRLEGNEINGSVNTQAPTSCFAFYGDSSTVTMLDNTFYGGNSAPNTRAIVLLKTEGLIDHNIIDGGDPGGVSPESVAVWVYDTVTVQVTNNWIYGGEGYGTNGLLIDSGNVDAVNNMIHGGSGSYGTNGIVLHQECSDVNIINNSIYAGDGERTDAINGMISNSTQGDSIIVNNIIHAGSGTVSSRGLFLESESGDHRQATLINNDFYDLDGDCLVMDHDVCLDDIAEVNACEFEGCVEASGNISAQPQWVSADDFHLTAGSLCIDAGIDPAPWYDGDLADFDFDGDPRPSGSGWDIGADEIVIAR